MRTRPQLACVLVLTALLAALSMAPGLAATAPAAPLPAPAAAQAAPVAVFLATLAAEPAGQPAATDCRISAGFCTAPQLCCRACGYFGCETYACFDPVNGHCPLFP